MELEDAFSVLKSVLRVGGICYILYRIVAFIQNFRSYAKIFHDCPGETDFHWLYGNLHKFPGPGEEGLNYDSKAVEKWPRFWRVWAGPFNPVIMLVHPDLTKLVLRSSAPKPKGTWMPSVYEMGQDWLGEGLLISNGAMWSRSRRLLTPAFHFDILKSYISVKNQAAGVLLDKMQQSVDRKESFEVFDHVSLCLFDVLLQCAFCFDSHCQMSRQNARYVNSVFELTTLWTHRSLKPHLFLDWIYKLTSEGRRWKQVCDYVHSVSEELINKRRQVLENEKTQTGKDGSENKRTLCFVDILLSATDEEGQGMSQREIRNEADVFLFAGFDTTTSALSWTLYSLAKWPQHQHRVQQEVDALLDDRSSPDVTWEDLSCLPYTTACIKEAIRNFTTVPFIQRQTTEPLNLDGHIIPANTYVALHLFCQHHNPTVWDRPHDYIPDRFLGDNAANMNPFQFVPFSAGPRNCIGQSFAMNELKILVARICHRYNLSLDPDHQVKRVNFATFRAVDDIKLFAVPR